MRDTSFGNKNEKFQEWLAQFQKEKLSLKSKVIITLTTKLSCSAHTHTPNRLNS